MWSTFPSISFWPIRITGKKLRYSDMAGIRRSRPAGGKGTCAAPGPNRTRDKILNTYYVVLRVLLPLESSVGMSNPDSGYYVDDVEIHDRLERWTIQNGVPVIRAQVKVFLSWFMHCGQETGTSKCHKAARMSAMGITRARCWFSVDVSSYNPSFSGLTGTLPVGQG